MSVTSYNVTAGEDFATIATLDGETKVIFSFTPNLIAVKATGDDASITVARFAGAQSGDDGVRTIASGESTTLEPYNGDKFVYVNGAGGVEVWAGRAGEEIPPSFKKSAKGGESGGGTHYRGATTTAISNGSTTNPITIDGESYTAVFGDIVVYNYTEFVFDGTQWSEFGRPFDTTPTSGSANAVTSDGIYQFTNPFKTWRNGTGTTSAMGGAVAYNRASGTRCLAWGNAAIATGVDAIAMGKNVTASENESLALGLNTVANQPQMLVCGRINNPKEDDLFEIGNGTSSVRSNILEANSTSVNINGDIKRNGVGIDDYTTTERKIGKWIDGSDLYQRTFTNVELPNNNAWNLNVLGTTGITIRNVEGYVSWEETGDPVEYMELRYFRDSSDYQTYIYDSDIHVYLHRTMPSGLVTPITATITIKYTKPVVNSLSNNIQTVSEPNEEPTEGEDMRSEPVEEISR